MKRTPERIERLAAEYVMGSLRGRARQRFERWMMDSVAVRREVWYWETRLAELAEVVPEQTSPERVWRSIGQRLWPTATPSPGAAGRWLLATWSSLATAAVMVLAVVLWQTPPVVEPRFLAGAIVEQDVDDPLWVVSEAAHEHRLSLRPVAAQPAAQDRDYELWVVPENGTPLSLGVVPVGEVYQVTLDDEARAALSQSRTLAISLEPRGGSPTGAPTGPILHVARLYEL